MSKIYLGDSVYAMKEDDGITLTTENGEPGDPSNIIFLEPQVLEALFEFDRKED